MLFCTLGASLRGNLLTGKGIGPGNKKGEGIVRTGTSSPLSTGRPLSLGFLMLPHPLTHFEIQTYYKNEPRFNGALSKIRDGA